MSVVGSQPPPSPEQIAQWHAQLAALPPVRRAVAARFPPWLFYRIATTGAYCKLLGVSDNAEGAVTFVVVVRRAWNPHLERFQDPSKRDEKVFGLAPDDLEMIQ